MFELPLSLEMASRSSVGVDGLWRVIAAFFLTTSSNA